MRIIYFIALTASALQSHAALHTYADYGPLQTYAQSPFITNGLAPQLRSGFSIPEQEVELYGTFSMASIWANNDRYELDYYQNQLQLGGKWQLNSHWQIELGYRWNYAANNHLDSFIIDFHDWFSIDQNGRDQVDKHRFVIDMPDYQIEQRDFRGEILSQGIYSYVQYQLYQNQHHGLSIGASLYYSDIGQTIFAHSDWEQAVQINYGYRQNKHSFDATLSQTFRDTPTNFAALPYRANNWSVGASYRYQWFDNHFLVTQMALYEGITNDDSSFADIATEFTLGYRYQMPSSAIELSVIENGINADNSTDVAFTLAYRYRFNAQE
ncbi:hypothetical protein VII00023_07474 [Vibrio ichthyoenteri ATCC 700023]|uniref:DUF3187 family protein n=1 Tax=Vibrio ichthyoenteri ATCC 700023 TaxID=870968 RepID=F9S247_9VIBR|nr:DUF3187 family protein [Vibrio ichthyoenteri]EGU40086.1 hypothetical protein VII00023_07474 [Vibrio ichthyoenteri ATCC 700023]